MNPRNHSAAVDLSRIDRLPPHSIEAEQGVLGCALLSPNEAMGLCIEKLRRGSETFYDLRHRALYEVLAKMHDAREPIDLIALPQRLKDTGQLEDVGGLAYLTGLVDAVPSAANLDYYLGIIREKFVLRQMIQTCGGVIGRVHEHEGEVEELVADFQTKALALTIDDSPPAEDMKSIGLEAVRRWDNAATGKPTPGIPCQLPGLAGRMPTFQACRLHIVGARPSVGKSSVLIGFAEDAAESGHAVGIVSLEMTAQEIFDRLASRRTGVPYAKFDAGTMSEAEQKRVAGALAAVTKLPIFIFEGSASIRQVEAIARRWIQKHAIQALFVDYLGLVHGSNPKANLYERTSEVSVALKGLAMSLRIPVIAACQLNRSNDREDRPPRLSDFRDSGSIEQDADVALLLHEPAEQPGKLEVILAKYRNGQRGVFTVGFNAACCRFTDPNFD